MQATNVIRVDLERLSSVLGCSVPDLIGGLRSDTLGSVEGARVSQGESATFSLRDASRLIEDEYETRVTSALISLASRSPSELDSDALPRQLLQLGGATGLTLIEIMLRNLYRGGIDRAVLLLGRQGARIREHIMASPVSERLTIEFINLGEDWSGFYAQSLLAARDRFKQDEPLLLSTSDHCFDPALIYEMCALPLELHELGRVLVEEDLTPEEADALPATAVHVQRNGRKVAKLWRGASRSPRGTTSNAAIATGGESSSGYAAIDVYDDGTELSGSSHYRQDHCLEAGLFTLTPAVFTKLAELEAQRCTLMAAVAPISTSDAVESQRGSSEGYYYTLAEVLNRLAEQGQLGWVAANGRPWLALETRQQLAQTFGQVESLLEDGQLLPWQCRTILNPAADGSSSKSSRGKQNRGSGASRLLGTHSRHSSFAAIAQLQQKEGRLTGSVSTSALTSATSAAVTPTPAAGLLIALPAPDSEGLDTALRRAWDARGAPRQPAFKGFAVSVTSNPEQISYLESAATVMLPQGYDVRGTSAAVNVPGTQPQQNVLVGSVLQLDEGSAIALRVPDITQQQQQQQQRNRGAASSSSSSATGSTAASGTKLSGNSSSSANICSTTPHRLEALLIPVASDKKGASPVKALHTNGYTGGYSNGQKLSASPPTAAAVEQQHDYVLAVPNATAAAVAAATAGDREHTAGSYGSGHSSGYGSGLAALLCGGSSSKKKGKSVMARIADTLPALQLPSDIKHIQLETIAGTATAVTATAAASAAVTAADVAGDPEKLATAGEAEVKIIQHVLPLQMHAVVRRRVPKIGLVILAAAALGSAFTTPSMRLLEARVPGVDPLMLSLWRFSAALLLYTPFFAYKAARSGEIRQQLRDKKLMWPNFIQAAATGCWGVCLYSSFRYTTMQNTSVFSATTPLMLVLYKAARGGGVTVSEGIGVATAVIGSTLMSRDRLEARDPSDWSDLLGILLALAAAACGAVYYAVAKTVRARINFLLFVWVGHAAAVIATLMCALVFLPADPITKRPAVLMRHTGAIGWLFDADIFALQILTSLLTDVVGSIGLFLVLKYLSPVVVSTCALLSPVTAVIEGGMLGLGFSSESHPMWDSGAILVLTGAGIVLAAAARTRSELFDATMATHRRPSDMTISSSASASSDSTTLMHGSPCSSDGGSRPLRTSSGSSCYASDSYNHSSSARASLLGDRARVRYTAAGGSM